MGQMAKATAPFFLNQQRYEGASILLARDNFGCGSSREHAPWALMDYGFRCIIAPSYADIFFNNCFKNGMLPVVLKGDEVSQLFKEIETQPRLSSNGRSGRANGDNAIWHDVSGSTLMPFAKNVCSKVSMKST